ncbi:MAG: hypothetical protein HXY45_12845 [Syntrophaceae bacterium]|nr:hypothetical protein [Syntrophaceae bacterium]
MKESPRQSFFYFNDYGQLVCVRHGDWKMAFMERRVRQLACWAEPFVPLRVAGGLRF